MVDTITVEKAFIKMGSKVIVRTVPNNRWRRLEKPQVDVREREGTETFILDLPPQMADKVEIRVIDNQPKLRHLLLQICTPSEIRGQGEIEKFLCGHDERHWFAASVKGKNVMDALQRLKPEAVQEHEKDVGVKRARIHKHHNEAWTRQGEWFFIPAPDFQPEESAIVCKNEPISRGRGSKPHICEELARRGGELVYVNRDFPNGLSASKYADFIKTLSQRQRLSAMFQARTANAEVYVRGNIHHPDHKTIVLKMWHRVQLNSEIVSDKLRFLD